MEAKISGFVVFLMPVIQHIKNKLQHSWNWLVDYQEEIELLVPKEDRKICLEYENSLR